MEQVSLLRATSYDKQLQSKIEELLKPLGGLQAFCKRGDKVLLKPNFIMARSVESAATTHPAIILAVATLLKDLGCEVGVGDSPGMGSASGVVHKLGLDEDFKRLQVRVVELDELGPINSQRSLVFERRFKSLQLAGQLYEYNRIINLPKLKSHGQMGITLATKNLFGCVSGHNKAQWHFEVGKDTKEFARLLVEIALTVNPVLHILDGIIGMDGNGPSNGRARRLNILMAGVNPIAVDRVVVEIIGKKPEQFPIFEAARILSLSGLEMDQIEVLGDRPGDCQIEDFKIPAFHSAGLLLGNQLISDLVGKMLRQRLILDPKLCTNCRRCEAGCPAKAIYNPDKIIIDEQKCIRCCCCQEMCPVGALSIHTPIVAKVFQKLGLM
ncbi:MAG TPA: DUF362 domain-containing protein [Bacillota bacterium]|nr:DUF362 domain-containing protein [Bacillota bacterium]